MNLKYRITLMLFIFLFSFGTKTIAQTIFVIDYLAVGIHEDESPTSRVIRVVPSGTSLELLHESANMSQIKTPDGEIGWIKKMYLMSSKPVQQALLELQTTHLETVRQLATTQEKVNVLTTQIELATATDDHNIASHDNAELIREIQGSNSEVTTAANQSHTSSENVTSRSLHSELLIFQAWHFLLFILLIGLSFGAGAYFVDWLGRRRHGGFRL